MFTRSFLSIRIYNNKESRNKNMISFIFSFYIAKPRLFWIDKVLKINTEHASKLIR